MCGIAGVVDFRDGGRVERETIERMCALVAHRGPDHEGIRIERGCGLGHRRLTLTDLVTGQQPLGNEDGTVWVVFNGEIYNYRELRAELEAKGHRFATQSDTEVIPHLYEEHGERFVDRLEGNWALALWDEPRSRLLLTRDRLGKKPLVWSLVGGVLRFASEAKALFADPALSREPDPAALLDIVRFGHVLGERTMFSGVSMVPPSTTLAFEGGRLVSRDEYWDFADVPRQDGSVEQAIEGFSEVFSDATRRRLMGDVPYGLLLSGGIDSSLVASFICEHEPGLKAYTISTGGRDDETEAARRVAEHVGADLVVVPLDRVDPVVLGARIPWMLDQPFFNDASFANYEVSRAISGELTVGITGDGGDHGFSGTLRHHADTIARSLARVPGPLVAAGVAAADAGERVSAARPIRRLAKGLHAAQVGDSRRWVSLLQHDLPIRQRALLETPAWRANGHDPEAEAVACYERCTSPEHLNRILYAETRFDHGPNDGMKVDRMAMYNGTAGRSPFLDRKVVEFAAGVPARWKRQGRTYKWLLREIARRRLPADIAGLPKTGLSAPLRTWLRGPLGDAVESALRSPSFAARGIYDQRGALTLLERHRAGRGSYGHVLWTMALTEVWYRSFIDSLAEPDERIWE